jgi:predicted DNA-binding transcriptional regulator AlpA
MTIINDPAGGGATPPLITTTEVRLVFKPEVCRRTGKTFPTLWKWMRQGKFPPARELGGKPAWVASEIDAFLAGLPLRA